MRLSGARTRRTRRGLRSALGCRGCRLPDSFPKEVDQFAVHFFRVGPGYAVRPTFHDQQAGPFYQFGGPKSGGADRHDPVRIAVNDQGGHIDAGQILAKVLMPCRHASETGRSRGAGCDIPARLDGLFANALAQQDIRVVEILEKLGEERVTVCDDGFLDPVEDIAVHALWVVGRLQKEGRNGRDEYRLAHACRSELPYVAGYFAAPHRKTDHREVL